MVRRVDFNPYMGKYTCTDVNRLKNENYNKNSLDNHRIVTSTLHIPCK